MNATPTLNNSMDDWLSVLLAAERTADTMRAEIDDQQQLLYALDSESASGVDPNDLQTRIDARMKQMNDCIAAAWQIAESVGGDITHAENDLRKWSGNVTVLRKRLGDLIPA
jgi:hypothetical protein